MALGVAALAVLLVALLGLGAWRNPAPASSGGVAESISPLASALDERSGRFFLTGFADTTGGVVVDVVDTRSGQTMRVVTLPDIPAAAPVIDAAANRAFVVGAGHISVLDATSGLLLRVVPIIGAAPSSAATVALVGQGRLYVAGRASVNVFNARSGLPLGTLPAGPAPRALALDAATQRLFVFNAANSTVSVIDTATGRLLRSTRLRTPPSADILTTDQVAVDTRSGRVFVRASNHPTVAVLDARTGALLHTRRVGDRADQMDLDTRAGHVIVLADYSGPASDRWGWLPSWLRYRLPWIPPPPPPLHTHRLYVLGAR